MQKRGLSSSERSSSSFSAKVLESSWRAALRLLIWFVDRHASSGRTIRAPFLFSFVQNLPAPTSPLLHATPARWARHLQDKSNGDRRGLETFSPCSAMTELCVGNIVLRPAERVPDVWSFTELGSVWVCGVETGVRYGSIVRKYVDDGRTTGLAFKINDYCFFFQTTPAHRHDTLGCYHAGKHYVSNVAIMSDTHFEQIDEVVSTLLREFATLHGDGVYWTMIPHTPSAADLLGKLRPRC
jgi:hypothetical protein